MGLKFASSALLASAAVLAMAAVGMHAWAEAPRNSEDAAAPEFDLVQADGAPESEVGAEAGEAQDEQIPELTEEMLGDPDLIARGEEIWQEQCRHCHGRAAYPGKAPRLRPSRYEPDFVYHRVTFGFRGMPGWEDVYSEEERIAVTAYVLSREFSP